jgi:autotransporter translocation and assembly factor TamB
MDTRTYDGLTLDRGSSPLRLTGTLDQPVLRGSVVLSQGDIYLTDELVPPDLETVNLTDAQIRDVEARFGRVVTARDTSVNRFTDALDYNLTVQIERNVWLRSNAGLPFDIEFSGDIQARKTPFAESGQLFGRIDLNRGSVETLSRLFELTDGSIVFNGDALDALIDLSADLDIRLPGTLAGQSSATITLDVNGRFAEDLTIRLSSNPSLDQADIVSLIATGRLASEAFAGGGGGAFGTAVGLAGGYAGGILEGVASENLGISMAQIDYEGGDIVIKLGDYLTSQAFLTVGFVVGNQDRNETGLPIIVGLDYELLKWLSAQAEYSGQRGPGGGLNYEVSW